MKNTFLSIIITLNAVILIGQNNTYTSNDTYTVPSGVTKVYIEVVGAGGNGGGNGFAGGGAGGYASGIYTVTPGQQLNIIVGEAGQGSIKGTTSVDALLKATGGENTGPRATTIFEAQATLGGKGGIGSGGNVSNFCGGNGGNGFWTYFGGGGGGAAGRNGNGGNGGNTGSYPTSCADNGGKGGISGGYPGGTGGKGAGYNNCNFNSTSLATTPESYGAGGGGGNGNGSPSTQGAGGFARISTCLLNLGITKIGLALHAVQTDASYQWINVSLNNTPIQGATGKVFYVTQVGEYALIIDNGLCSDTTASIKFEYKDIAVNPHTVASQEFSSDGTFKVDNSIQPYVWIETLGAGGNGGGNGFAGGGGGGYASGSYPTSLGQEFKVIIGKPGNGPINGTTSVDELLYATGGENTGPRATTVFEAQATLGGKGGVGYNGNLSNFSGGNGGNGFWTYFGGGGGGAAGRNGDGGTGGNTGSYPTTCADSGGTGGISGGFPGGKGGKGAGYDNCNFNNTSIATTPELYGAGGAGGNGNGSPSTQGTGGYARISYCHIDFEVVRNNSLLTVKKEYPSYQWVKIINNSKIELISGAKARTFTMTEVNQSYAVIISDQFCSGMSTPIYNELITGIINTSEEKNILAYPNPFTTQISIQANEENVEYEIRSIQNELIWKGFDINEQDFTNLPQGIYLLIQKGNKATTQRIMKQ